MAELKNTFVKSKMNKDLDARLVPNGEYRDAMNVSVSTSEGADVGALENIRGNFELTNFGLTDLNLEVIGTLVDPANNRIYFFITNFFDGSRNQLDATTVTSATSGSTSLGVFTRSGAKNYIAYCQIPYAEDFQLSTSTITSDILVEGAFLNFSKSHPISGVNLVENLLFWTDNRNQPRKINTKTAISNPLTYYTTEDDISVAKVAPYKPISFLNDTVSPSVSTLKNEVDEWLPATFIAPAKIYNTAPLGDMLLFDNGNFGNPSAAYASPVRHLGSNPSYDIRVYKINDENRNYAFVRDIATASAEDRVRFKKANGTNITNIATDLGWGDGTFAFEVKNPNYNPSFSGDKDLLKDKFVKFSYRFKYDDDEYSIMAPFSQEAFIPRQYGYFLTGDDDKTKESSIVDFMENQITTAGLVIDMPYSISDIGIEAGKKLKIKEVQILYKASNEKSVKVIADADVNKLTGSVTDVSVVSPGGLYPSSGTFSASLGVGSGSGVIATIVTSPIGSVTSVTITSSGNGYVDGDILTIPALGNPPALPSGQGATVKVTSLSSKFIYEYSSQKPIKVLDEQEIIRVNDIIPIRAKSQEAVGNRIVYGNFLQNNETPESLNYSIVSEPKGNTNADLKKEFHNHTLKQGRVYQVGLVLQDRYGRSSNVIITNNTTLETLNSTYFSPYSSGGTNPLTWAGNSLKASFVQEIPTQKTDKYSGLYDEANNPLGWYTYKIVVKQQEQDYYNVYTAGCLSGNINFLTLDSALTYDQTADKAHVALFNDNINKIPRDLNKVGPSDDIYGSSVILYNRVKNTFRGAVQVGTNVPDINDQNHSVSEVEVTSVRNFREIGEWTTYKNVNIQYVNAVADGSGGIIGPYDAIGDFYIYPGGVGNKGGIDPFYLKNNKNPLIATLEIKKGKSFINDSGLTTSSRLGYSSTDQESNAIDSFAKKLMVFETKPFKSNLDIYYETSSTGLISDFNTNVAYPTGSTGQPVDISTFVSTWKEDINNVTITNVFQCVDSAGNFILSNNPTISIDKVENLDGPNGNYAIATNPFTLQTIQQPAFNVPATYSLATSGPHPYTDTSYYADNYKITFKLSATGMQDVYVDKNISLSNIKPEIRGLVNNAQLRTYSDFLIPDNAFIEEKTQGDINNFVNGTVFNWTASPLDGSGNVIPYSTVKTALITGREQVLDIFGNYIDTGITRLSHTTNGCENIVTPTSANLNAAGMPRVEGLEYSLTSAIRHRATFNGDTNQFKRYNASSSLAPEDKTFDFSVDGVGSVYFNPGGTFPNSDWNWHYNNVGAWKPAYVYIMTLGIKDASAGLGNKQSTFSFFFILTKKDYS